MKERPILFSGAMVRALLAGTKTQTRRVVKDNEGPNLPSEIQEERELLGKPFCPYGQPGDRLWVREAWSADAPEIGYRADMSARYFEKDHPHYQDLLRMYDTQRGDWRPSIHMPRWASRILLEIVSVRVERLQDISEADALYEGTRRVETATGFGGYVDGYRELWESINGPGSWAANPWVWVVEFKRVTP